MNEKNANKLGYKVVVSGVVQGVGFRYFTAKEAKKWGITGYAKNLSNGSVEVLIFGDEANTEILLKWLEKGPETSIVNELKMTEILYIHKDDFTCL